MITSSSLQHLWSPTSWCFARPARNLMVSTMLMLPLPPLPSVRFAPSIANKWTPSSLKPTRMSSTPTTPRIPTRSTRTTRTTAPSALLSVWRFGRSRVLSSRRRKNQCGPATQRLFCPSPNSAHRCTRFLKVPARTSRTSIPISIWTNKTWISPGSTFRVTASTFISTSSINDRS